MLHIGDFDDFKVSRTFFSNHARIKYIIDYGSEVALSYHPDHPLKAGLIRAVKYSN